MKTFTKALAAAALLASTSTAALAQADVDAGAGVSGDVGVETESNNGVGVGVDASGNAEAMGNADANAGGDGEGGAAMSGDADAGMSSDADMGGDTVETYGDVVSSLQTGSVAAADIEAMGADAQVDVVTLADLEGNAGENAAALDQAVTGQQESLEDVKAAIEANADVSAALEAEGFSASDIVAVTSTGEGMLTVVVDDSM